MEHHHRPMVDGKASEATLELVAIDDHAQTSRLLRLVSRKHAEVRRP
jgi:hypothetical protein